MTAPPWLRHWLKFNAVGTLGIVAQLAALWILAILTNVTAVQRIWVVWQQARRVAAESPSASGVPTG